jgi:hypothetical protein
MSPAILKLRIDIYVAMIIAGAFFTFVGFASAYVMGFLVGLLPAGLGILGLLSIVGAVAALYHRNRLTITIDSSGITVPTGTVFRPGQSIHIPRDAIATIGKDESIRGRLIAIALRAGGKVPIQARNYCELKTFLSHCKDHGLPTA